MASEKSRENRCDHARAVIKNWVLIHGGMGANDFTIKMDTEIAFGKSQCFQESISANTIVHARRAKRNTTTTGLSAISNGVPFDRRILCALAVAWKRSSRDQFLFSSILPRRRCYLLCLRPNRVFTFRQSSYAADFSKLIRLHRKSGIIVIFINLAHWEYNTLEFNELCGSFSRTLL